MRFDRYLKNTGWAVKGSEYAKIILTHAEHGTISIIQLSDNIFTVRHAGAVASVNGKSGKIFATIEAAIKHTGKYIRSINDGLSSGNKLFKRLGIK